MKDVVVIAGAIGSSFSICKSIRSKYLIKTYIIFLNSNTEHYSYPTEFVTETANWVIDSASVFFERINEWYSLHAFKELPVLYCTSDESCMFVAQFRECFESKFILTIPDNSIISIYNNKERSDVFIRRIGLLVPNTLTIKTCNDIETVKKVFRFPVIIKPIDYQNQRKIGFKVKVCDCFDDFSSLSFDILSRKMDFLCQEYIPGGDDKSWFYIFFRTANGVIVDCMGKKIVQHPTGKGNMAMGITCRNEKMAKVSQSFLKKIGYVGIGGIEFKEYMGDFYFIEMSTRPEGFIQISNVAETPLPLIAYYDANLEVMDVGRQFIQKDDRVYVDIIIYLVEIIKSRKYIELISLLKILSAKKTTFNPLPFSYYMLCLKKFFLAFFK